jgi:uncharacterized membrane protein YbhN (UPF0104 family)
VTWKRWLFTAVSFAAVIGISVYFTVHWWRAGSAVGLPARAHIWALTAVMIEIVSRSLKISWGARALGIRLPFLTAVRTNLAGDFGASITPARTGAEPTRYLVLAEAGIPANSTLVVLYIELFLEMLSLGLVVGVVAIVVRGQGALIAALGGMVAVYSGVILGAAAIAIGLSRRARRDQPPGWARWVGLRGRRWMVAERWFAQLRATVERVRDVNVRWAAASLGASIMHVAMRLCVLPALVLGAGVKADVAPLALWPLALLYGSAAVPAPGGGGAVEWTFTHMLTKTIGVHYIGAALLWWRFYTFYIYILLGAAAAGRTVLRAIRKTDELEEELVAPA